MVALEVYSLFMGEWPYEMGESDEDSTPGASPATAVYQLVRKDVRSLATPSEAT